MLRHPKPRSFKSSSHSESDSIRFSRGSILCCKSLFNTDVLRGNKRLLEAKEVETTKKIYVKYLNFGFRTSDGEDVHIEDIKSLDMRTHIDNSQKEAFTNV